MDATTTKSLPVDYEELNSVGRSYYCYCLETALDAIVHSRALVEGDITESNHELPEIESLIRQALRAA